MGGSVAPARACARGVHKAWSGPRGVHADVGIRNRRIQTMLTMFSKRSETYKQLIVAHLYRNSLIIEVGLASAGLVVAGHENLFTFRAQPKNNNTHAT